MLDMHEVISSSLTVPTNKKREAQKIGLPFLVVGQTRTTRAERKDKQKEKLSARRSREGSARRFAEGAPPAGFRQILTVPTKKRTPF